MNLEVHLGNLTLETPLIGASGLFGYATEYGGLIDCSLFGAIVTKTITLEPWDGNPPPRIVDVGCGLLNSIGLENVGVKAFLREKLPQIDLPCTLFVSIGGQTVDEFRRLAALLADQPGIAAIEVNISCPNVEKGGIAFGKDAAGTRDVIKAVRAETGLPVIPKLPPLVSGIEAIAEAACEAGADALTVANTYPGMAIDLETEKPILGGVSGGYSGRAIRPMSVFLVWKVVECVKVPVIAAGGIEEPEHAIEYILAGASAFEIGSAILRDLEAPARIIAGLRSFMRTRNYKRIEDFEGKARRE